MTTTTNLALALGAAGTSSGDDDGRGRSGAQDLSGDDKDSGSGAQELVNGSVRLRSCGALVATAMAPVAKITITNVVHCGELETASTRADVGKFETTSSQRRWRRQAGTISSESCTAA
ncbi:Os08g0125600 [Oryza sativa Japonica Group]|uniref:Uncharacterized protein n=2 Tax=Oryza sativa subsp. japonica TaxID=39947 RepID=A0A0P0XBH1_ORYSJ|nr:hypothetical protein [Oryza sativa Japonica Group]BAD09257.1 hypothetical protein [Oryza sativa Japonica Group]BAT03651.1 Os08g0125600 [Oryza sativa Japonica Group]